MKLGSLDISYRCLRVLQRHRDVFWKNAKSNLIPPFFDPLFYLLAMGYGLGALVAKIKGLSYPEFIAPAIAASVALTAPSFECIVGTLVRMKEQKTWDAMIHTPVSVEDVITGEILFGAARSVIQAVSILIVIWLFGLIHSPLVVLLPLVIFISGIIHGSLAMTYTSFFPEFNYMDYYFTLVMTPMFLFAGTFFPVERLPGWAHTVAWFMPLYHTTTISRALTTGLGSWHLALNVLWLLVACGLFYLLALVAMKRRVIK